MVEKEEEMSDIVLDSVKTNLGIIEDDKSFDDELVMNINAALSKLSNVGLDSKRITKESKWDEILDESQRDNQTFNLIESFITTQTKLLFDPPAPATLGYMKEYLEESIWRIKVSYDTYVKEDDENGSE